jgi:DNA-directed RNA polymerase subunit RPC12/RpoP
MQRRVSRISRLIERRPQPVYCPECGMPLDAPQLDIAHDLRRASNSAGRIPDRTLFFSNAVGKTVNQPFYLCTRCDREFLVSDIENRKHRAANRRV